MSMALGGTIGVGNIAGVSAAITAGGPGAVFWMWISGFLGMIIKYCEVALSVRYRIRTQNGQYRGGPMYYMLYSDIKILRPLAYVFSFFCILASLFMGNISQSDTVSSAFQYSFGAPRVLVCSILCVLLIPVIVGKAEKLKDFTSVFVPLMSIVYIVICFVVIGKNIVNLPSAINMIFKNAFSFGKAAAGIGGYGISKAISTGFSRGLFTNEAGLGSAPMAHATNADATEKMQGMWGIAEVFIDTILVCSLTAFAVLCSNTYRSGTVLDGIDLTSAAFSEAVGKVMGEGMIAVSVAFFAFASMVAWNFYGRCAVGFFTNKKIYKFIYSIIFILFAFLGAFTETETITALADVFNAPLIFINLPAIAILYPLIINKLRK